MPLPQPPPRTSREWLETNGIGGFAAGTSTGIATRRYHGLLFAAINPPVGRTLLLARLEDSFDGVPLSANRYAPDVIHPRGHEHLTSFRADPFPTWTYDCGIERTVFLVHGENTCVIEYTAARPGRLTVRPLVAFRDYHALRHENGAFALETFHDRVCCRAGHGGPELWLAHGSATLDPTAFWYRNFEYTVERARGLDFLEDLYSPCAFAYDLEPGRPVTLIASTGPREPADARRFRATEQRRRPRDPLPRAADQFLVSRGRGRTVIAGYPWFADWGRDTMIALPGLARGELARDILLEYARHIDHGLIPNRFPDAGEPPEYNTVDASLWFFEAAASIGDPNFVRTQLLEPMRQILDWHQRGTRHGIHMDSDGLLAHGAQLTWMDAVVNGAPVTPRDGKAVEIQALWYNALRLFADWSGDEEFAAIADRVRRSFDPLFWDDARGWLADCAGDPTLRPNQLIALSLSHPLVEGPRAHHVLDAVDRELLTPYGPRTLAPSDPRYLGRYEGGVADRDAAYHNGPVWPWLLAPYAAACARNGRPAPDVSALTAYLEANGQLPELFDGDPPHAPGGAFAQAWSVAALASREAGPRPAPS